MRLLWSLLIVDPLIVVSTVCCASATAFASPKNQTAIARFWGRTLLVFAGVKVEVEGIERIQPDRGYVFASNHLSYMDTPVMLASIPADFRFLAKAGLFKIPFLGSHLKRAGHISVPRDDPRAAIKTLSQAAATIEAKKIALLVFPEGGRSATGELQPFEEGAAYLAIKGQVPIVPMALIGTRAVLPMHGLKFTGGRVKVRVGEPIPTAGMTVKDREQLTASLRDQIVSMLGEPGG
jgi:1-acyl-sn-glycerol-3-phosphate acyltransferase